MLDLVYLAIDIGNGGGKASICDPTGRPTTIRTERGGSYWPSVVFLTNEGEYIIGEDAREQAIVFPAQAALGWKMHLADPAKKYFGGKASAKDVLAIFVKAIIVRAEKQLGVKVDGGVVTCPANFNEAQKQALLDGFAQAGVEVIQLLTEPAAAAFAYSDQIPFAPDEVGYILCRDLGAGTFDVSILEIKGAEAIPIATEGIPKLGGRDFSNLLKDLLFKKISQAIGKVITSEKLTPEQNAEVDEKVEKAKLALSVQSSTKIAINFGGKAQLVEISQSEYESSYAPLVQQMKECSDKAMKSAKKEYKNMNALILAGGPHNSPKLQEDAANHTGLVPKISIDPICAVSYGAAMVAYQRAREDGGLGCLPDKPKLREATGHDIGVCVIDASSGSPAAVCSVVIPKNTPVSSTFTELYRLERESQTEALIDVLQGPNVLHESKCIKIGSINLTGLPPDPKRSKRIEVLFKIDKNGICSVTATDKISGKSQTISIKLKDDKRAA